MMLELKNICKTYTQGKLEVPVLKEISLSVEEGEYVAIMGPSGSGKTTLMNIIGCLDSPTSGEYLLEGEDIAQNSDSKLSDVRLKSIGFVFQSFYLLSRQSALENVALPLLYAGVRRKERLEIARKALERVGLGDRVQFKPTQLSGGQCQRVAIARAIVNNPKILLADEPTGALDTQSGEQIMEIFQRLNREGVTIVMITHEQEIAAHARRVLHIRDGRLLEGTSAPQAEGPSLPGDLLPPASFQVGSGKTAPQRPAAPRPAPPVEQAAVREAAPFLPRRDRKPASEGPRHAAPKSWSQPPSQRKTPASRPPVRQARGAETLPPPLEVRRSQPSRQDQPGGFGSPISIDLSGAFAPPPSREKPRKVPGKQRPLWGSSKRPLPQS